MRTHNDKPNVHAPDHKESQKATHQPHSPAKGFQDNRGETLVQRKLKELTNAPNQSKVGEAIFGNTGYREMQNKSTDAGHGTERSVQLKQHVHFDSGKDSGVSIEGFDSQSTVQRAIITAYESDGSTNVKLDKTERLTAFLLAKDIESILEQAQNDVDEGYSDTPSSRALFRDGGTRARGAKRGTAIHSATYEILGEQLKGYGSTEMKITGGRADIIINLFNTGKLVIYDLTSFAQGTKTHTAKRGYENDPAVAMILEITYDDY